MKKQVLLKKIEEVKSRSAWEKGVKLYAYDLVDVLEHLEEIEIESDNIKQTLLNGARDFKQYSWDGCSLIYNQDIAKRLCSPSELKKTRNGERKPNKNEEWLDTQARALAQAYLLIKRLLNN